MIFPVWDHGLPAAAAGDVSPSLVAAVTNGEREALQAWLASGGSPNAGYRGRSLLGWAAAGGSCSLVEDLLAAGASAQATDARRTSPLFLLLASLTARTQPVRGESSAEVPQWAPFARAVEALLDAGASASAGLCSPAFSSPIPLSGMPSLLEEIRPSHRHRLTIPRLQGAASKTKHVPSVLLEAWRWGNRKSAWLLWEQGTDAQRRAWANVPRLQEVAPNLETGVTALLGAGGDPATVWPQRPGSRAASSWLESVIRRCDRASIAELLRAGGLSGLPPDLQWKNGLALALCHPEQWGQLASSGWRCPDARWGHKLCELLLGRWLPDVSVVGYDRRGSVPAVSLEQAWEHLPRWGVDVDNLDPGGSPPTSLLNLCIQEIWDGKEEADAWVLRWVAGGVDAARAKFHQPPLHEAALLGKENWVRSLLEAGVPVDVPDSRGRSAFQRLVASGSASESGSAHRRVAEQLLAAGARINFQDAAGKTALHELLEGFWVRCFADHREKLLWLLARGAQLKPDYQGETPLHVWARQGAHGVLVEELKEWWACPHANAMDASGCRPFDRAVERALMSPITRDVASEFVHWLEYCPHVSATPQMSTLADRLLAFLDTDDEPVDASNPLDPGSFGWRWLLLTSSVRPRSKRRL